MRNQGGNAWLELRDFRSSVLFNLAPEQRVLPSFRYSYYSPFCLLCLARERGYSPVFAMGLVVSELIKPGLKIILLSLSFSRVLFINTWMMFFQKLLNTNTMLHTSFALETIRTKPRRCNFTLKDKSTFFFLF